LIFGRFGLYIQSIILKVMPLQLTLFIYLLDRLFVTQDFHQIT